MSTGGWVLLDVSPCTLHCYLRNKHWTQYSKCTSNKSESGEINASRHVVHFSSYHFLFTPSLTQHKYTAARLIGSQLCLPITPLTINPAIFNVYVVQTYKVTHSGCAKSPIDIDLKVGFQYKVLILQCNSHINVNGRFCTTCMVTLYLLTKTPVTVTQYEAMQLHEHFLDFPNGLSYSKLCLATLTHYGTIWLQWHVLPFRGCHCKRVCLYYRLSFSL